MLLFKHACVNSTRDEKAETKNRVEEILVSKSSLVSGLSEASGDKFSRVEVSQETLKKIGKNGHSIANNITSSLANITNSLTNSITYIPGKSQYIW